MKTKIEKRQDGWNATTYLKSEKGSPWIFKATTLKALSGGGFYTFVTEMKQEGNAETYMLFSPEYRSWRSPVFKIRGTEKTVAELHDANLAQFFAAFPETYAINQEFETKEAAIAG